MTELTLTKDKLRSGVWEGTLRGPAEAVPTLALRHNDQVVPGLELEPQEAGCWTVRVPVPVDLIDDDFRTFVIVDEAQNAILASFAIFAGEQLSGHLQTDVDLLRAELDLLKRAFRQHFAPAD